MSEPRAVYWQSDGVQWWLAWWFARLRVFDEGGNERWAAWLWADEMSGLYGAPAVG